MRALVVVTRDPLRPAHRRTVSTLRRRRSLAALAPRARAPVICAVNGRWMPRAAWNRRVRDGDVVAFVVLPQGGGGGSDPLRILLSIAIAAYAPVLAGELLGTEAVAAGLSAIGMSSQTFVAIAGAGISMIGNAVVNALIPPAQAPKSHQAGALASPSPTYSLAAQGNTARLGQPIPTLYGRHLVYPDFAARPYVEYAGNEQYLYQLFVVGQGEYELDTLRIEDTDIGNFDEITYEIVPPGSLVTLFPINVVSSIEVAGQEALYATALGPFTASGAGELCDTLGIDVVMPRGLFYANDEGGLDEISTRWKTEARLIDDSGAPLAAWFELATEFHSAGTTTPVRLSYRYGVPLGRYEVRFTRMDIKQTDPRYSHELSWAGLRAYLPGSQDYGALTLIAVRAKATNNLSSQASRRFNLIATRKMQAWSAAGGWAAAAPTRSIAWALADVCRAAYGAGLDDARIDLAALESLDAVWTSRGDTFDGVFDSQGTVMEALSLVARAGRAIPYLQGGIVHFARDAAESLPVAMFTQRNIVRGSFAMDYLMPSEETADAIDVAYFDASTWTRRTVRAQLPGSAAAKPAQRDLFGVTSRDQAWREGMYMAACNRYRRRMLKFETEMEGFIPAPGDLLAVQHDMPSWGQSGEIVAWDEAAKSAIVSDPLDWTAGGAHVLALRRRDGSAAGPYTAVAGVDAYHVTLSDWVAGTDPTPDTGTTRERTHYAFGPSNAQYILARALAIRPRNGERVELAAVVESDYVHTADTGAAPGATAWQLPATATAPVVAGLVARSVPGHPEQMVISWRPAAGADHYLIEQSNGSGAWTRCGEVAAANFTAIALYGANTLVRVAAVGLTRGPWIQVNYDLQSDYFWTSDSALMWTSDSNPMWTF